MSLQVTGKVKTVFPTETKGNFSFRILWLTAEHETQYPQTLEIQFPKEKGDLLNGLNEGDIVTVDFNLRGRVWNNGNEDKVFNTVSGWKLSKNNTAQPAAYSDKSPQNDTPENLPF